MTSADLIVKDPQTSSSRVQRIATNMAILGSLRLMALRFNHQDCLREQVRSASGWLDFCAGLRTEDGHVQGAIRFRNGRAQVMREIPENAEVLLTFRDRDSVWAALSATSSEQVQMLLEGRMQFRGSYSTVQLFLDLLSVLPIERQKKALRQEPLRRAETGAAKAPDLAKDGSAGPSCEPGESAA